MRYLFLLLLFFVNSMHIHAQKAVANDVVGKWMNNNNDEIIEISRSNNEYVGKIIWLKEPNDENGNPRKDINNPDKKLRNRNVLGLQIISGLIFEDNKWQKGTLYSPDRGGTINCEFTLLSMNEISIKVSKGFFRSTKKWKRQ